MPAAIGRRLLARAAAWALLSGGWIVLAPLSDRLAPGPLHHAALLLAWLLALAGGAALLERWPLPAAGRAVLGLASAVVAARALALSLDGAGWWALWPALLAWALLAGLAAGAGPAGRNAGRAPLAAAAAGALLAWAVLGDPTDLRALVPRAALLLAGAALLLAALGPRAGTSAAAPLRSGLPGCLGFGGARGALSPARPWPVRLAALAMLPMMAGLPQMLALCRSDALGPSALLGLHLAAMFLPGLCLPRLAPGDAARPCLLLLIAAGVATLLPAAAAAGSLALAAAWSLAWAAREAPQRCASAPRQHVAEHLEGLPGGLGR